MTSSKRSMSRRSGKINDQRPTTPIVAMPPNTMAGPTPSRAAATPLSNDPTSLEAPMNTFSTADTRPRIGSGVASGTMVERMNTLTASAAASTTRATNATA